MLDNIQTKFIGKRIIKYDKLDSTQLEAWRLIDSQKAENGTIIISEIQTNGIGTHGRKWYTDKKGNIAFSIIVNCECDVSKLEGITVKIANTIVYIFKQLYGIMLYVKFPNDIVVNGKKIGGILTEIKTCDSKVKYMVIGIGLNISQKIFDDQIENIATSIENEFGIKVDKNKIITEFCQLFEKEILKILDSCN